MLKRYLDAEGGAVGEGDERVNTVAGSAHAGGFATGPIENDVAGVLGDGELAVVGQATDVAITQNGLF